MIFEHCVLLKYKRLCFFLTMSESKSPAAIEVPVVPATRKVVFAVQVNDDENVCAHTAKFLIEVQKGLGEGVEFSVVFIASSEFDVDMACATDLTSFDAFVILPKNSWCEDVAGFCKSILSTDHACTPVTSDSCDTRQKADAEQFKSPFYVVTRTNATFKPFYDAMKTVRILSTDISSQRLAPILREALQKASADTVPLRRVSRRAAIVG